jgi:hypothetical protein
MTLTNILELVRREKRLEVDMRTILTPVTAVMLVTPAADMSAIVLHFEIDPDSWLLRGQLQPLQHQQRRCLSKSLMVSRLRLTKRTSCQFC